MYFGQGQDFKLTTELSEKVQHSHNQAIKNGLNEAILLMLVIRTFSAQPVKVPHFKTLLTHTQAR